MFDPCCEGLLAHGLQSEIKVGRPQRQVIQVVLLDTSVSQTPLLRGPWVVESPCKALALRP